jgi:hypothetical protein
VHAIGDDEVALVVGHGNILHAPLLIS